MTATVVADPEQPMPLTANNKDTTIKKASQCANMNAIADETQASKLEPEAIIPRTEGGEGKLELATEPIEPQYPEGVRLLTIIVALILTMILVSLDEVRTRHNSPSLCDCTLNLNQDHPWHRDSQDNRRISRPRQSDLVWLRLPNDFGGVNTNLGQDLHLLPFENQLPLCSLDF